MLTGKESVLIVELTIISDVKNVMGMFSQRTPNAEVATFCAKNAILATTFGVVRVHVSHIEVKMRVIVCAKVVEIG